ncbi:TPA: transcriptional regulator, partial [Acinetobacter baumannii]
LIDKNTGQQIPFMVPVAADGKVLKASDTQVQKVK